MSNIRVYFEKRKIVMYILTVLIIFAIWTSIWLLVSNVIYSKYTEVVPKDEEFGVHFKVCDGYLYSVAKPKYPVLTGNLVVKDTESKEALFIWPKISGGYVLGIKYIDDNNMVQRVYIDNTGKVTEELAKRYNYGEDVAYNIEKRQEEIAVFFTKAFEMWGIEF